MIFRYSSYAWLTTIRYNKTHNLWKHRILVHIIVQIYIDKSFDHLMVNIPFITIVEQVYSLVNKWILIRDNQQKIPEYSNYCRSSNSSKYLWDDLIDFIEQSNYIGQDYREQQGQITMKFYLEWILRPNITGILLCSIISLSLSLSLSLSCWWVFGV